MLSLVLVLWSMAFFLAVGLLVGLLMVAVYRVMRRTPVGVRLLRRWQKHPPLLRVWQPENKEESTCSS